MGSLLDLRILLREQISPHLPLAHGRCGRCRQQAKER